MPSRLLDARHRLEPRADALLRQIEDRLLLLEIVVGDIEQRIVEVELDVGLHHRHRDRQARGLPVGLGGLLARERGREQLHGCVPRNPAPS